MKKYILFIILFTIAISSGVFNVTKLNAQSLVPYTLDDSKREAYLTISPKYPKPGQSFTVTINSFAVDLDSSNIKFYENGVLIQDTEGINSATYTGSREVTNIRVVVNDSKGISLEKTQTIRPGSASIIWNADTYTPPFYKGKKLYSTESSFVLSAITDMRYANGTKIPNDNIVFNWKINGESMDQSGRGSSKILVTEKFLNNNLIIELEAEEFNGNSFATERLIIEAAQPEIVYYNTDPLLGTDWYNAVSTTLLDKETTISAIPFYFATQNPRNLSYIWKSKGETLDTNNYKVTFRNETSSDKNQTYSIETIVEKIGTIFQSAKNSLTITAK